MMRSQICKKCNFQFSEAYKDWDTFQMTGKCPKCEPSDTKPVSGKKFVIALVSWTLVGFGALSSLMFAATELTGLLPLISWASLGIMTFYWLRDNKCHWIVPFIGTFAGVISALIFAEMFLLYVWGLPLACYLVYWHLSDELKNS